MGISNCCKKKTAEENMDFDEDGDINNSENEQEGKNVLFPTPSKMKKSHSQSILFDNKIKSHATIDDFQLLKLLGIGAFGRVILVKHKQTNKLMAMKTIKKSLIKKRNEQSHTKAERKILEKLEHPFIVELYYAFHDETSLFLVTEFLQGGELFFHLHKERFFNNKRATFYAAEIALALDYMHRSNCIYRDLKPENVLLGKDGHIKLTDFGLSKIILEDNTKAYTICGTPEYLAPEILENKGYDNSVDWWSLGTLIYQMLSGTSPFKLKKGQKIDISNYKKQIPLYNHFSSDAKKIIRDLLVYNPIKRLGYGKNGFENIKNHPFFKDINWDDLYNKKIPAPFVPEIKNDIDLSNFDKIFTDVDISNIEINNNDINNENDEFGGFSYVRPGYELNNNDKNNYSFDDNVNDINNNDEIHFCDKDVDI